MINNSNKCNYPEHDADMIIPGLWLGNIESSQSEFFIKNFNIRKIINVTPDIPNKFKSAGVEYLRIPIGDGTICDNNNLENLGIFDKSSDFIHRSLMENKNILVHCKRGHHRSAAIVCGFLYKYLDMPYYETISFIHNLRKCALRRDTCIGRELFKYYNKINNIKNYQIKCQIDNNIFFCENGK